jgi:hypothetical protein
MGNTIFVGVFSGILTYFIIVILVEIFNKLVIPWYQSIIYRGISIEGNWFGYDARPESKTHHNEEFYFEQKSNHISGDMEVIRQPTGEKCRKKYRLEGIFRDNNLIFSYQIKDKSRLGSGTFVLKLIEDGQKFEGVSAYISPSRGEVITQNVVLKRRKNA